MKGSIANGSRRTTPTAPVAAAVVSDESVAPMKTPWFQSRASVTRGIVVLRRPPERVAADGEPLRGSYSCAGGRALLAGPSYPGARIGHWLIGVQKRLCGWLEGSSESGVQSWCFQLVRCAGGSSVMPSHQMSPSSVSATLVNTELPWSMVRIAFGLVFHPVPGATPNRPYSGLSA